MQTTNKLIKINALLVVVLLVVMPFHAAIVTVLGHYLVNRTILSLWKELLSLVVVILSIVIYYRRRSSMRLDSINIIAMAIIVLSLVISLIVQANTIGVLAGIKTNLVVLALFLAVQPIASYFRDGILQKLILIPAVVVASIAILQPVLLPPDLLIKIGYGVNSIDAFQFVESSTSLRVFSTLGGPNQLGTYMIVPFALSLTYGLRAKKYWYILLSVLFALAGFMTYSRSAWIGMLVAGITILVLQLKPKAQAISIATLLTIGLIGGYIFATANYCTIAPVRSVLHGDCYRGQVGGSDSMRIVAMNDGRVLALQHPFGQGLGVAGPASFYTSQPLIFENWYLQIAVEIGLIGLLLYLMFYILQIVMLYRTKEQALQPMSHALIAILLGVSVAALFLHSWADSTLSIIVFILLGIQKGLISTSEQT